jgi:hypothetical protein
MNFKSITIVADGSSDACLVPIADWILRNAATPYKIEFAKNLPPHAAGLRERIKKALALYPCDILIVHRDVEKESIKRRRSEIEEATNKVQKIVVMATPIRMTEAWLLIDEKAIRTAADNPNGGVNLSLPSLRQIEDHPNPKIALLDALRTASELRGRRRDRFLPESRRHRVAELIEDYSKLRNFDAFKEFESSLMSAVDGH